MFGIDYCFICKKKTEKFLCDKCSSLLIKVKEPLYLDNITVYSSYYYNFVTKKFLMELKYNQNFIVAKILASSMAELIKNIPNITLVPIPTSIERLKERTYNQSVLICKYIQKILPFSEINFNLLSKNNHQSQKNKTLEERKNIKFNINSQNFFIKNTLVLVDDIIASGSTLNNAAKTLRENLGINLKIIAITYTQTM